MWLTIPPAVTAYLRAPHGYGQMQRIAEHSGRASAEAAASVGCQEALVMAGAGTSATADQLFVSEMDGDWVLVNGGTSPQDWQHRHEADALRLSDSDMQVGPGQRQCFRLFSLPTFPEISAESC